MRKTILAASLLAALVSCHSGGGNNVQEETYVSDVPAFCEDSAYSYVAAQCDFGPRTVNSEAHDACGDYIAEKFRSFGAEVTEQYADTKLYDGTPVRLRNIVASYNPDTPVRLLVCAHWDSRPWADHDDNEANQRTPIDGANDGASGVGVMLELARQIQQTAPAVGIDFICFDAEDCGMPQWADDGGNHESTWCLGSQHWASFRHKDGYMARYGILLDMVGGSSSLFCKEGFSMHFAPGVVDKIWAAARRIGYSHYFVNESGGYVTDDHVPVNRSGIPCVDIIASDAEDGGFCGTWHTVDDNLAHISRQTLKAVGQTMMEVIYNEK
ncbi:MAG: M28 family peptidase [Bacteroides sp.]|nr:M28 family peptidase [Roseburia sp.]MCM1346481.1 M28 family peptidase [Bacteroides sp.]MCM1420351.1 M28 family peptidase [Bacteroides sp.]